MFEVAAHLIIFIQLIILLILTALSWIYILPIIFNRRLHTVPNLLTCNVCLVTFLGSLYWAVNSILNGFYSTDLSKCSLSCTIVPYVQTVINCLMIYGFLIITINRFFLIIYPNKRLFKRLTGCFVLFAIQFLIAIILPLPYLSLLSENCVDSAMVPLWIRVYRLSVMVILPSTLNGIFNLLIFLKVKSSTARLSTGTLNVSINQFKKKCFNSRDICLLNHMLFLHVVFVIGWAPISLLSIIEIYVKIPILFPLLLRLLPPISLVINIIDLFSYNHELRQYYSEQFSYALILNSNK